MAEYRNTLCCGVAEVHGIQTLVHMQETDDLAAEIWLKDFIVRECAHNLPRKSHLFFTQALNTSNSTRYGDQFREFIERAGLGTVWASPAMPNPNTSNLVTLYVWMVNRDAFKLWAEKHKLLCDGFGRPMKDGWQPHYNTHGQQVPQAPAPATAPAPPARPSRTAAQDPTVAQQAAHMNAVNRVLTVEPNRNRGSIVGGGGGAVEVSVVANINPF